MALSGNPPATVLYHKTETPDKPARRRDLLSTVRHSITYKFLQLCIADKTKGNI